MTPSPTIEQLWNELRAAPGGPNQRRVDDAHPLDLYADFEHPDRPGLVAVCASPAARITPLRAVSIDQGVRADGRWSLRLVLNEPQLLPVFSALCRDIVASTRKGVSEDRLANAVVGRIDRWRSLLQSDGSGLGETKLRGLFGELLVLEKCLLPMLSPEEAVRAWTGPEGAPQDFLLPSGAHIEVKTIGRDAGTVRINGLGQLDAGPDPLVLALVRVETAGSSAPGAVTVPVLIGRLRGVLTASPDALVALDAALACMGWHDHAAHEFFALRPLAIDEHDIDSIFPKLTRASVPDGVADADYLIVLPRQCRTVWRDQP